MLTNAEKEQLSKQIQLYRMLSGMSVRRFAEAIHMSSATYAKIQKKASDVSTCTYDKILSNLCLTYHKEIPACIKTEIMELHKAINYFDQENCKQIIDRIRKQLEAYQSEISCVNLTVFFQNLSRYFSQLYYLSENSIRIFMQYHDIFGKEMSELICFYCVYSSTMVSFPFEKQLYEQYPELEMMDYLPIQVHLMTKYQHDHNFEKMILLGETIKERAIQTNNQIMLYEYWDCIVGYYVQIEPNKIKQALKEMYRLAQTKDFPLIKKKQFYENYGRYCMKEQDYQTALDSFYQTLKLPENNMHVYSGTVLDILFCESQLDVASDFRKFRKMNRQYFESKSDYGLYCYYCEKQNLKNHERLAYLERKVLPYLTFYDNIARHQIEVELEHFQNTSKKLSILKRLKQENKDKKNSLN